LALAGSDGLHDTGVALPVLRRERPIIAVTDVPATRTSHLRRSENSRYPQKIDGPFTPKDQFFTTQHYGHPEVDLATSALRSSGLVDRRSPCRSMISERWGSTELVAGFECSGNSSPAAGSFWKRALDRIPLKTVLIPPA